MEKFRTFIAISLPQGLLSEIENLIQIMKKRSTDVKWVKLQSVHLTLKFLGNLSRDELQKVFSGMNRLFRKSPEKFQLNTGGLGAFPNFKKPRVLWVGIGGSGIEALQNLQTDIETELEKQGFPKEHRKFSPHLTVGRIKFPRNLSLLVETFSAYSFPTQNFTVDRVLVMRSDLRPSGAVYSVQQTYMLMNSD
jgi:2'-5' RNA ligase